MTLIKERTISLIGTVGFHLLLILFLLLYYIKPDDRDEYNAELGGVPVMFGNVANAGGDKEAFGRGNGLTKDISKPIESDPTMPNYLDNESEKTADPQPQPVVKPAKPAESKKSPTVTQDMEETIALEKAKKAETEKRQKEVAEQRAKAEAAKIAQEEANRKKNINSQMAGLFGNGSGSGSRGNTQGTGTQGSPSGNGSTGKVSGIAGTGTYDLGGRGVGSGGLQLPSYHVDDYGTVVVDIIVEPNGNVIEATIGKGTNTTNSSLRNESLRAARRTKFRSINTANNQKGTITYKFNLN